MTTIVSRGFIRGRHAVALAVLALVCLGALAGALHAAAHYERIAQVFVAIDAAEKAVERVLAEAEPGSRADPADDPAPDATLADAAATLSARVTAAADALAADQPALADDLRRALTDGALATFLAAAGALPGQAATRDQAQFDPAHALHAMAHGPVTDVFVAVRERLDAAHAAFARRARALGFVGLGALTLALAGIALLVLRPMERRILATQAALARETERAQAAERRQGAVLAQTSHEIRTSLNGVIGMSELLARTELEAKQAEYLGLMRASGAALLRIINDVLDYSKLAAGEMTFERRPLSPAEVVGATVGLFAPQFAASGVALGFESAETAAAPVLGDAVRLRQVASNLLSNAAKYTARGAVTVRLSGGAATGTLRLEVEDTGEGIPPEKVGLVFENWRQLDSAVADQSRGTGLGLALTRSMVEGMGGRIGVRSALGEGSTFWVELPAIPDASTDALRAAFAPEEDHAMTHDPVAAGSAPELRRMAAAVADGRPPRVLLADDNDVNRMIAETLLTQLGCVVETVRDGAEAVHAAQAGRFDVILMDVSMPVMNGLDATRAIRAHERERGWRTPIVALTAHALEEHLDRCLDAGMDGRLVKPFRPEDLGRTIAQFLAEVSGETGGAAAG